MTYSARDRERWVSEDPAQKLSDRDDFARDRGRLIHSAALRRLSAKTQVLAPGTDDFVRNRLTHSLEVAQIGREFGEALGCNADLVDTACLAHDLGHPPFGHNGESALDALAAAIGGFEGNAQSLRILTRLEPKRFHQDGRSAGLNLTRASLDAATKYPWTRTGGAGRAKFGVYADDLPAFEWFRRDAPDQRRSFEAQVMDWSDDVAYSVHDVEDAVASGRLDPRQLHDPLERGAVVAVAHRLYAADLSEETLADALSRLLQSEVIPRRFDGSAHDLARLKDMTSRLIGRFVRVVHTATRARYGPGSLTRYGADLVVTDQARAESAVLKGIAAHYVMSTGERLALQEREREIVADLVTAYLSDPARLDANFRGEHTRAADDAAALRVIIDQVASLTDLRARYLHEQWCVSASTAAYS